MSSDYEQLEMLNQMLPLKCQGCPTGVAELLYLGGLSNVLGEEEASKALTEIEDTCEGFAGEPADLRNFVDEDGKTTVPLSWLLVNPNCPTAQRSQAECDEQWDRMTK